MLSENEADRKWFAPSHGIFVSVYGNGLEKGALKVCVMGGIAVLSVIDRVPVGDGLLNSMFPETENVFVNSSQGVVLVVMASMEQCTTLLQLVTPEPPVCENVIIPAF